MMKTLLSLIILTLISCSIWAAGPDAKDKKEEAQDQAKTEWCQKNPGKCAEYETKDEWINKQVRDCIDEKGNHNGKAEKWEIKKYADECR